MHLQPIAQRDLRWGAQQTLVEITESLTLGLLRGSLVGFDAPDSDGFAIGEYPDSDCPAVAWAPLVLIDTALPVPTGLAVAGFVQTRD